MYVKTKLPRKEREQYKRQARDIVNILVEPLKKMDRPLTKEEKFKEIVKAYRAISHLPIPRMYLHDVISQVFDYDDRGTIRRIVDAYDRITTDQPDIKSLAGYYRTWQKIFEKEGHAA